LGATVRRLREALRRTVSNLGEGAEGDQAPALAAQLDAAVVTALAQHTASEVRGGALVFGLDQLQGRYGVPVVINVNFKYFGQITVRVQKFHRDAARKSSLSILVDWDV
jgi:hypothetical protein